MQWQSHMAYLFSVPQALFIYLFILTYKIANLLSLWKAEPSLKPLTDLEYFWCQEHLELFSNSLWAMKQVSASCVKQATKWPEAKHLENTVIPSWPCPGMVRTLTWPSPGPTSGNLKAGELQQNVAEREANQHHQQCCITLHTEFERVSYFSRRKMGYLITWKSYNFGSECTC